MTKNSLPIIQALWIGNCLSLNEQLCIRSFLHHGHPFHLYVYENVQHIPIGTTVLDANEIIPKNKIFTYSKGSYAGFADWFRWELLYQKGNYYVDTDVICLKRMDFDEEIVFGIEEKTNRFFFYSPAVLRFPKGFKLCKKLAFSCKNPNMIMPWNGLKISIKKIKRCIRRKSHEHIGWGESGGPFGFSHAIAYYQLKSYAQAIHTFCPIHWSSWKLIYDGSIQLESPIFEKTVAIHLWNEMGRKNPNFDKNAKYPEKSIIGQLRLKYGCT